ncbi:MAG: glycoside hydrolase family 3 protein, partial [Caulobacteraceae bacterium]|nr:glycoside hydrolase family 3 protein [Caulobacteraceae bacterium]
MSLERASQRGGALRVKRRRSVLGRVLFVLRLRIEEALAGMRHLGGLIDDAADHALVSSGGDRIQRLLAQMSEREKQRLLWGYMGAGVAAPRGARRGSAGYVPGNARLGIPPQWQTDGGMGVATQPHARARREFTAMPSGLALAATWDEDLAGRVGAAIGREVAASGHNVLLGGAVNLVRDPRSGRAFEMAGEDPLLAGRIVGAQVIGVQSNPVICTVKHFALNNQETGRHDANVLVDEAQARMSDLLAFQIAIETGAPRAVMSAYNRVNGVPSSENRDLLDRILRREWGWGGYVMSDWGGVHSSVEAARAGLDQQSAASLDDRTYFGRPLKKAVARGELPRDQLDRMAGRVLRMLLGVGMGAAASGLKDTEVLAHERLAQEVAENGAVLLKNVDALLPLQADCGSIALIGRHADLGVLSGGGSSQVYARGRAYKHQARKHDWPVVVHPSSPLAAIRAKLPGGQVHHEDGRNVQAAVRAAERSDVAIVIVSQWSAEGRDNPFDLACGQDGLIEAVAAVNANTIVVLETGGAVAMPWSEKVKAILQLWYPGSRGGSALAELLFGDVNPS